MLNNKNEQEKLNNKLKTKLSIKLNISEDDIILTNPQKGSYRIQLIFINNEFNKDVIDLNKIKELFKLVI